MRNVCAAMKRYGLSKRRRGQGTACCVSDQYQEAELAVEDHGGLAVLKHRGAGPELLPFPHAVLLHELRFGVRVAVRPVHARLRRELLPPPRAGCQATAHRTKQVRPKAKVRALKRVGRKQTTVPARVLTQK